MIIFCAKYVFLLAPTLVLYTFWRSQPRDRRLLLLRGLAVLVLGFILAKGGGALFNDPRPFVIHHTQPLIPHVPDNGFPSDHTLVAAGCGFLLAPFSVPASILALIVAVVVGASRVACGLHSPIDVIGSIIFALLANVAAFAAFRPGTIRRPPEEQKSKTT